MDKRQLLAIFILIVVCFTLVELNNQPKKKKKKPNCKLRRCKRPVYNVLGTKIGCKAGLRYLRCVRRVVKRCPKYRNMFTNDSWADFKELMADAKATYKQAGARCRIGPKPNGEISGIRIPLQTILVGLCIWLTLTEMYRN